MWKWFKRVLLIETFFSKLVKMFWIPGVLCFLFNMFTMGLVMLYPQTAQITKVLQKTSDKLIKNQKESALKNLKETDKANHTFEMHKPEFNAEHAPCPICHDHIANAQEKFITQCNHVFHKECIRKNLAISKACSCCRAPICNVKVWLQLDEFQRLAPDNHLMCHPKPGCIKRYGWYAFWVAVESIILAGKLHLQTFSANIFPFVQVFNILALLIFALSLFSKKGSHFKFASGFTFLTALVSLNIVL